MLHRTIGFNGMLLGLFALVTAGVVATTQQLTSQRIADAKRQAAQAALYQIIPRDQHDNDLLSDIQPIPTELRTPLGLTGKSAHRAQLHIARRGGEPFAAIVPTVAPDGYSGAIHMIMGIDKQGRILGLRVTSHNETPGLGDKIDLNKSNWILSFNDKTIDSAFIRQSGNHRALERPGDFDQLTGATITRKAVTRQVERTLDVADRLIGFDQAQQARD